MPTVPESHLEERRAQIVRAALRCYERKGFHRTSVRDICDEAGLSVGAVYRYFDGKNEILAAVAEAAEAQRGELLAGLDEADGAREAVLAVLRRALTALRSEDGLRSARMDLRLRSEALDVEPLRKLARDQYADLRDRLAERLSAATPEPADEADEGEQRPANLAQVLVALIVGAQTARALDPGMDPDALLDGVRTLVEDPGFGPRHGDTSTEDTRPEHGG